MKTAILQVADTGPLESLVIMLRSVGYQCYVPSTEIKNELRRIGCDTVLDISGLVANWGYSRPMSLPDAPIEMMETCDLYVDIKAHRNGPKIWERWPYLRNKTLWYRINGGAAEITEKGGDEVNLLCPILTPNKFYADPQWADMSYVMWPPFYRFDEYPPRQGFSGAPICLIHGVAGWGYHTLIPHMQELGVKFHGAGSPDGLIPHGQLKPLLANALAMVHLKSNDCPGYAIYEAMAAACPLVVTRRMIWRMRMEDLLVSNETCLVFDRTGHQGLTAEDLQECRREVSEHLDRLRDPAESARIGQAGRERLKAVMWDERKDSAALAAFMEKHFP